MITMIILFIAIYAWQLFSWSDIHPLSLGDLFYMLGFTIEHMLYEIGFTFDYFEDGSALITWSACLSEFCR